MNTPQRFQDRLPDALRTIDFQIDVAPQAMGSVLVSFGKTQVICAASIEPVVPR